MPCLHPPPPPPQFCSTFVVKLLNLVLQLSQEKVICEDNAYAKIWEENKVYYGRFANGKLKQNKAAVTLVTASNLPQS